MAKSPEITLFLNRLSTSFRGELRTHAISKGFCVVCGQDAVEFRDDLSEREFKLSGMCQVCQDDFFGSEEE